MRLDQKYFVPFILVCAAFTMLFIVISSFNFTERRQERFTDYTRQYNELLTKNHPYINKSDSLRLGDLKGNQVLVLFWASWSDKSAEIMKVLDEVKSQQENFKVVAALVKDATESIDEETLTHDFEYIDGTILFNELRAPGIPSFILLDESGELKFTHVGYKEGKVSELLMASSE
ncbi:MAG: hypothetical protein JJ971_09045 [Balneolaceae bacterium]|nr:hypothetical protein [Balneolaceae bacterium]MBO6546612.1 hypothetical protein [Balneolaceae bacterium]MBO6648970.1 hypothetical protein [Balneolaceae bacterium]